MPDLAELLRKYRQGRDGFDGLVVEVTQLYAAGRLLPAVSSQEEPALDLAGRIRALVPEDVERALGGKLGTVPLTREEYDALLRDITDFLKEWLGEDG